MGVSACVVRVCVRVAKYVSVNAAEGMCTCVYAYVHVCRCVCVRACVHVCAWVCVHVYGCGYAYVYVYGAHPLVQYPLPGLPGV